jgi:hypothetical protein
MNDAEYDGLDVQKGLHKVQLSWRDLSRSLDHSEPTRAARITHADVR